MKSKQLLWGIIAVALLVTVGQVIGMGKTVYADMTCDGFDTSKPDEGQLDGCLTPPTSTLPPLSSPPPPPSPPEIQNVPDPVQSVTDNKSQPSVKTKTTPSAKPQSGHGSLGGGGGGKAKKGTCDILTANDKDGDGLPDPDC